MDLLFSSKSSKERIFFLLILLFIFILTITSVQTLNAQVDPALSKVLQRGLDSLREKYKIKGVSAAIMMHDNDEWLGASGILGTEGKDRLTTDMLLSMGSITKTFTCAVILQLASENKLSLEDSLYKWLPKYKNIDSTITIRQLLNHTSGIYNYTDNNDFWSQILGNLSKRFSPEDVLSLLGAPSFKAGSKWAYSNTNYILLGMIIKRITGSELSAELHKRLLTPFNLQNTFLDVEDTIKIKIADGWADVNLDGKLDNLSPYPRTAMYSLSWSAGGMVSNPSDLAKWAKYLYGGQVLEKKYLDQMLYFTNISGNRYGLATAKTILHQREFWGHSGGIPGYVAYTGYCKQDDLSIAVMINQDKFIPETLVSDLLQIMIHFTSSKNESGSIN